MNYNQLSNTKGRNINFIDEQNPDEFYVNLFGSKKRKESIQGVIDDANKKWGAYALVTCDDAKKLFNDTQTEIALQTKLTATSNSFDILPKLQTARVWQAKAQNLKDNLDCDAKQAANDLAAANKLALDTATNLSDATVAKAATDLSGKGTSATDTIMGVNKNLVIYGGIGIGALIVLALVFKGK
jgi:hypothetical protein